MARDDGREIEITEEMCESDPQLRRRVQTLNYLIQMKMDGVELDSDEAGSSWLIQLNIIMHGPKDATEDEVRRRALEKFSVTTEGTPDGPLADEGVTITRIHEGQSDVTSLTNLEGLRAASIDQVIEYHTSSLLEYLMESGYVDRKNILATGVDRDQEGNGVRDSIKFTPQPMTDGYQA